MHILVPTDFSEQSKWAIELAQSLSKQVDLLHLVQAPAGVLMDYTGQIIDDGETDLSTFKNQLTQSQSQMQTWQDQFQVQGLVRAGSLTTGIIQHIEENGHDLLIMGTKGNSGIKELLSHSGTASVTLQSPIPVLSVKCDRKNLAVRNALIIGEFNSAIQRPLSLPKEMVSKSQGTWHLMAIHAEDTNQCDTRTQRMEKFAEVNELGSVQMHFHRSGDAELAIAQVLQEQEIDLLCIAIRRKNLSSWLRGNLAIDLVNHFHKPIYTYPVAD